MREERIKKLILIGFPFLAVLGIFWAVFVKLPLPCVFRIVTGLYCPMCGATRAVISIVNGDFISALRCNAVVALLFYPGVLCGVGVYLSLLTGKRLVADKRILNVLITILAIFIVFGVVRNISTFPFIFLIPQ